LPCAFWDAGFLAYKHRIVGIHSPIEQREDLAKFYEQFIGNQHILRAFCAISGTEAFLGKATSILKRDIDVLPWPREASGWALNWWEQLLCDEVVRFSTDFVRLGQNSALLRDRVDLARLGSYCEIFLKLLGSIYTNLRPFHPDIPLENTGDSLRKCRIDHRVAPLPLFDPSAGTGSETSRKSPVASRRYTDVLSALRWPRMSPIVFRGVPFLSN
jgi:hypothetical protein